MEMSLKFEKQLKELLTLTVDRRELNLHRWNLLHKGGNIKQDYYDDLHTLIPTDIPFFSLIDFFRLGKKCGHTLLTLFVHLGMNSRIDTSDVKLITTTESELTPLLKSMTSRSYVLETICEIDENLINSSLTDIIELLIVFLMDSDNEYRHSE